MCFYILLLLCISMSTRLDRVCVLAHKTFTYVWFRFFTLPATELTAAVVPPLLLPRRDEWEKKKSGIVIYSFLHVVNDFVRWRDVFFSSSFFLVNFLFFTCVTAHIVVLLLAFYTTLPQVFVFFNEWNPILLIFPFLVRPETEIFPVPNKRAQLLIEGLPHLTGFPHFTRMRMRERKKV